MSETPSSMPLGFAPAPVTEPRPFRFLNLPGELRNKIYHVLLCAIEPLPGPDQPGEFHGVSIVDTPLRHSIETKILRTCRFVNKEATYLMRKTNLFIKVMLRLEDRLQERKIFKLLIATRIPHLNLPLTTPNYFKEFVMTHEIASVNGQGPETLAFGILFRELPHFCRLLEEVKWTAPRCTQGIRHIVTLVDPYASEPQPSPEGFLTQKLQEKLLAPYRSLRGLPNFTIQGALQDLAQAALTEIQRSADEDPDYIIRELTEAKNLGGRPYRSGDIPMRLEIWLKAADRIYRLMIGSPGAKLREVGGPNFTNALAALLGDLCTNIVDCYLKSMRKYVHDHVYVPLLAEFLFIRLDKARGVKDAIPGCNWELSLEQATKLFYKEAVACRLTGKSEFVERGARAIMAAATAMPRVRAIREEKKRIEEWKKREQR